MASECICTFAQRLTGDGCHICNPDKARDYEADAEPARVEKTKFYAYRQNNSGGKFKTDPVKGIDKWVIIEARDHLEANVFAEDLGLYWNGVNCGLDCGCCGDRWDRKESEVSATEFPSSDYGQTEVLFGPIPDKIKLMDDAGYVHYRDGTVKSFYDATWLERTRARMEADRRTA